MVETSFSQIYHYYIRVTKFHTTGDFRKVVWMQCQSSWPITSSSILLPPLQICSPFFDTFNKYMVLVPIKLIQVESLANGSWAHHFIRKMHNDKISYIRWNVPLIFIFIQEERSEIICMNDCLKQIQETLWWILFCTFLCFIYFAFTQH